MRDASESLLTSPCSVMKVTAAYRIRAIAFDRLRR